MFLKDYDLYGVGPIQAFLDFGYPLGEAVYVSLAIMAYLLTYRVLGGAMRNKILMLVIAYIIAYITDSFFLARSLDGSYYNGGPADLLYASSFLFMSLAILNLKFLKLSEAQQA